MEASVIATPAFHSITVSRTRLMMSRPTPGKPDARVASTAPDTRSTSDVRRITIDERSSPPPEGPAAETAIEHPGAQDEGGLVRDRVRAQVGDVGDDKEEDDEPEQHADQDGIPVPMVQEHLDDPGDERLAGQDHE